MDAIKTHYICNLCSQKNKVLQNFASNPGPMCSNCNSSVRFRFIGFCFSSFVMNGDGFLPSTKDNQLKKGIGLSDSPPLARVLKRFSGYTNTFFHASPQLDITQNTHHFSELDYIISSDVFEHTIPPALSPFLNAYKILNKNGLLILSVPTGKQYLEHFPDLNDFKIINISDKFVLVNATKESKIQVFEEIKFHGGPGATLEMRVHSISSVKNFLTLAGFKEIKIVKPYQPQFGIFPLDGLSTTWVCKK